MTYRLGIVGAGTHGARYLNHATNDVEGLKPVIVARRDAAVGQLLATQHGVRFTTKGEELIDDPEVEAVVIATPPSTHFDFAARALAAGKPVLLEKPMTGTLAEARRLHELATAPDAAPLMVAQTLRWNPVMQRIKELWPRLGRVHHIRLAQRLAPTTLAWQRQLAETVGGSVLLTGVHIFDLARWLSGHEVLQVDARHRQVLNPAVEDFFLARAELDDGCWVSFEVSKYTQSRACWIEVVGENGQIWGDYLQGGICLRIGNDEILEEVDAGKPTLPAVLSAWLDIIKGESNNPVTSKDGLRTLEIAAACYASADQRKPIDLDNLG